MKHEAWNTINTAGGDNVTGLEERPLASSQQHHPHRDTNRREVSDVVIDVTIIEPRSLTRECLVQAIRTRSDFRVGSFSSIELWRNADTKMSQREVLLLSLISTSGTPKATTQLMDAIDCDRKAAVVVFSDDEEPTRIVETLQSGVRGYIPTSLSLAGTVSALRFVADGGTFVPASSLHFACQNQTSRRNEADDDLCEFFTPRQQSVVRALCQGKPNKIIAYELNMCESTVKVHIRNIMKKLKAKNRTEVVIMAQKLSGRLMPSDRGLLGNPAC